MEYYNMPIHLLEYRDFSSFIVEILIDSNFGVVFYIDG